MRPQPNPNPDWRKVNAMATSHFLERHSPDYHEDNDDKQYIFEAVMEAVYGEDVWVYLNKIRP